jgi:hypothetical protein
MRAALLVALLSGTAIAQVTVRATAVTDLWVRADASPSPPVERRIAASTDVTRGFALSVSNSAGGVGTATSSARSALSIDHGPGASVVELRESADGGVDWIHQGATGTFGPHELRIEYRSPRSVPALLRIEWCSGATDTVARVAGQLTIDGTPRIAASSTSAPIICRFGQYPQDLTLPIRIGPGGTAIGLATTGWAIGTMRGIGTATCNWRLTLTLDPDSPCVVTPYGDACGASLSSHSDLRYPGMHVVELEDPSAPPLAWLVIGLARSSRPFLGCTLLTDERIVAPWTIDPGGRAVLLYAPPPIPGLALTAQGLTLGAAFHASEGLEFLYR